MHQIQIKEGLFSRILREKAMADKLVYIPNDDTKITLFVHYYKWLKRFDTQHNESNNQNFKSDPKKWSYKILGTSVILSRMSPHSLIIFM